MTVYRCLHWLAPTYLADDCLAISAIAGKRHLRFTCTGLLSVPGTRTTLGMRSFAVAGPVISNSLPATLWTTLSPLTFARPLKAHLFGWSIAHLRIIYDALYKSTHHHHQPHTSNTEMKQAQVGSTRVPGDIGTQTILSGWGPCPE